jgi:hypothetical protein
VTIDPEAWFRIAARIRKGEPLPAEAREWLLEVLDQIRRGEDPRPFAGTMPPKHRPPEPRAIIGLHYWLLRKKYGKAAAAEAEVMAAWGLGKTRVGDIKRNCENAFRPGIERMSTDELDALLADVVPGK